MIFQNLWQAINCRNICSVKSKSYFKIIVLSIATTLLVGCVFNSKNHRVDKNTITVFFNSFETARDTQNWYWGGDFFLSKDTPPGGGHYALEIQGIRILPMASFISKPLNHDAYYTLQCWGKTVGLGGVIKLEMIKDHRIVETIQVPVLNEKWTFIQSEDTLYCPKNSSLMLSMHGAGIVFGDMLVDLLEIKRIKKLPELLSKDGH